MALSGGLNGAIKWFEWRYLVIWIVYQGFEWRYQRWKRDIP